MMSVSGFRGEHVNGMMGLYADDVERGRSPGPQGLIPPPNALSNRPSSFSPSRPPTSAEIDAVIAAAMANAPPAPSGPPPPQDASDEVFLPRSVTPLMTNLLPSAVGVDGRVNLFVGNLPYRVRWQDLKDLFRKAGTVLRADVSLGPDNRSRGYGTVLMGSREDAARAIDRFNGFTWQTRTLEVRPDRLPPEYEPQPHQNHHIVPPRPPLYTYHNMSGGQHSAFSLPGHLLPSNGPAWLPGQIPPQRPPMNYPHGPGSGSQQMMNQMSMPGMSLSPHPQIMSLSGSSPIPVGQSPNPSYGIGGLPLPLSGQNTGNQIYQPLGASPLAGSLTAGILPGPSNGYSSGSRRESFTPFSHSVASDSAPVHNASPALNSSTSRPSSSAGPTSVSSPDLGMIGNEHQSRQSISNHLGSLTKPIHHVNKPVIPTGRSGSFGEYPALSPPDPHAMPSGPLPTTMEGLAHQGPGLGPPSTLHDRVVFVSNLPLTVQWQELKDLLRPAGVIIRADVATDADGRPRGFGTALFASENDASKAVTMYNDRDLGGHRIRVHLERDSHHEHPARHPSDHAGQGFGGHNQLLNQYDGQIHPPNGQPYASSPYPTRPAQLRSPPSAESTSPIAARLPWALNMSLSGIQTTPARGPPVANENNVSPHLNFRQMRHPGPISMPAFPNLDNGNPLSPLQTRNLPPMTPSMPGFVFHAYPETPPIHPHFLSPGVGPFSPGIPVTSPTAFAYNPFLNPAPGAPVNRYPQGGSAQLGTPTTQSFSNNPVHGYAGASGQPNISQALAEAEYFPTQPFGSAREPSSPSPVPPIRPSVGTSPLNAKDRLAADGIEPSTDLSRLTASMSLNDTRRPSPPSPTRETAPQRSSSGFNLVDLARGDALALRASLDGPRPTLDVGWTGERRASFGDIGSRDMK